MAQLAQRARLELADALACDAQLGTDVFERARALTVEAEAQDENTLHAGCEPLQRIRELAVPVLDRRALVRLGGV